MDRRAFISRAALGGAAAKFYPWRAAQAASSFPGILLIDGVTPGTSASGLFAFIDPIVSQNIPVGIAITADRAEWERQHADAELMKLLSTLIADYPGLIDLAIEVPGLASLQPYLRMRAASEGRNRLQQALLEAAGSEALLAVPRTIVSQLPVGQAPIMDGLRSAGILSSFLLPQGGTPLDIWRNKDGTQQINGGWRLPPSPSSEAIAGTLSEATVDEGPVVFATRFPGELPNGEDGLFDKGAILGDGFRRNLSSSRNYLILPSELRLRSGAVFSRHIVLCIRSGGAGARTASLTAKLAAAGIAFTEIAGGPSDAAHAVQSTSPGASRNTPHQCVWVSGVDGKTWQDARLLAFGSFAPDADRASFGEAACAAFVTDATASGNKDRHAGFEIILNMSGEDPRFVGFDDVGALRLNTTITLDGPKTGLSTEALRKRIESAALPGEDVVLLVNQDRFRAPEETDALVEGLAGLGKSDRFNVLSMKQYLEVVSAKSVNASLLRKARRWPARRALSDLKGSERDRLLDDAEFAWSYVEQLTEPDTGLVPATAWLENGKLQTYNFSTMWDTGSLILAIVSAHSIGLLTDAAYSERINAVLGGLATRNFNELRLPKGLTSTNGGVAGDDNYNASDTARLLVSLHLLETYTTQDLGIRGVLDGWDLDKAVKGGTPLTARGSRLVSSYRSNYAGYIARAFRLWGFPVKSPYSDPNHGSSFDRGVHILHEVADLGPIGTEPHLLETVELGPSDLASAVSDALFAAQVDAYLASGKLVCVSEGPINREPWFVYQGFQIGEDGGDWTAETLDPSPRFKTKGFIRAVEMLNSKAAFLWSACRPGDYSDLLLSEVRDKAKVSSLGFSPGVFYVTGKAEQAYSDINTNAVILQAIAYRLNASKPGVEWRQKG